MFFNLCHFGPLKHARVYTRPCQNLTGRLVAYPPPPPPPPIDQVMNAGARWCKVCGGEFAVLCNPSYMPRRSMRATNNRAPSMPANVCLRSKLLRRNLAKSICTSSGRARAHALSSPDIIADDGNSLASQASPPPTCPAPPPPVRPVP